MMAGGGAAAAVVVVQAAGAAAGGPTMCGWTTCDPPTPRCRFLMDLTFMVALAGFTFTLLNSNSSVLEYGFIGAAWLCVFAKLMCWCRSPPEARAQYV